MAEKFGEGPAQFAVAGGIEPADQSGEHFDHGLRSLTALKAEQGLGQALDTVEGGLTSLALTLLGLARLMRTSGAKGFLLPFVVALCVAVMVRGIGRGDYDGLLGDALHGQCGILGVLVWCGIGGFDVLHMRAQVGLAVGRGRPRRPGDPTESRWTCAPGKGAATRLRA